MPDNKNVDPLADHLRFDVVLAVADGLLDMFSERGGCVRIDVRGKMHAHIVTAATELEEKRPVAVPPAFGFDRFQTMSVVECLGDDER